MIGVPVLLGTLVGVPLLAAVVGFALVVLSGNLSGAMVLAVMVGALALVLGTLNLLGPWTIGVMARVLVRRATAPAQLLAARRLDAVRRREVLAPLVLVAGTSTVVAWLVLLPLSGMAATTDPQGIVLVAVRLVVGTALVVGATELSRPLLRSVLAETVVRAA